MKLNSIFNLLEIIIIRTLEKLLNVMCLLSQKIVVFKKKGVFYPHSSIIFIYIIFDHRENMAIFMELQRVNLQIIEQIKNITHNFRDLVGKPKKNKSKNTMKN